MIPVPMLAKAFRQPERFVAPDYELLPLRFLRYDQNRYLLTNLVGEYTIISDTEMQDFVGHRLRPEMPLYDDLKAKHFLYDSVSDVAIELLATKYRTKQSLLPNWTALHLFVVSLRCDHSCPYCQVSRVSQDRKAFDMSRETADRAIGLMFQSPCSVLKLEFQGGEALFNFEMVQYVVQEAKKRNDGRRLEFVIATNLSPLTDEMLIFCREHEICLSTSLDGPRELHNANRPRPGQDSYERAVDGIRRARTVLGPQAVSALMTTTMRSLSMPREIIDEYIKQGFRSIFLRPISPYGFALKSASRIGYSTEAFLDFYRAGLEYILELNQQGILLREEYATVVLRRALTPFPTGYVDLQSPSGLGSAVIVYNYDGDVYASDEGRMLAETHDKTFRLGNVHTNSYRELFLGSSILTTLHDTMAEGIPGCCDCAYLPWCGTDPVFHYATQGDPVGHRPTSGFCQRNMGVFRLLVEMLESDTVTRRILQGWAK